MSNLVDLHVHTKFSYDCLTSPIKYIASHDAKVFIQTDHAEFMPMQKLLFDAELYKNYLKSYNINSYCGVEIGFHIDCIEEIKSYITNNDFDLILLAIHNNSKVHYYDPVDEFDFDLYIKMLNSAISNKIKFDVLAHIDFPFRMNKVAIEEFKKHEYKFKNFFYSFIHQNKYLELNTSSLYHYKTLDIYTYLFNLYYECGGRRVSIGSDCHNVEVYRYKFTEAVAFLNNYNNIELLNERFKV